MTAEGSGKRLTERNSALKRVGGRAGNNRPILADVHPTPLNHAAWMDEETNVSSALQAIFHIIAKRKLLIASIVLVSLATSLAYITHQPPLYTASTRIQIDVQPLAIVGGDALSNQDRWVSTDSFLRTQHELLRSRALAERVVSQLQLYDLPDFFTSRTVSVSQFFPRLFGPTQQPPQTLEVARRRAVDIIVGNFSVRPVPGSRLVDLRYSDIDPQRAALIVNTYAQSFINLNQEKRLEANTYAKTYLNEQIQQLKLTLKKSEKALVEFAEHGEILGSGEKSSTAEASLAAANASLGEIVAQRIKSEQIWKQASRSDVVHAPQLLSSPSIEALRSHRRALQREYEDKLKIYKPNYPSMTQLSGQLAEIDRQLAAEVKVIHASLKAAYETALQQEEETRARIEELRKDVLELQRRGVEHGILKREVETNRNLYDSLLQRLREVDIASGVIADTVLVVETAEVPVTPGEPRPLRVMLLALAIGIGGGFGLAYTLELLDDKVRTPDEIEELTGLPVLGAIPTIRSKVHFEDEIADPHSPSAEAYRSLATALQFATAKGLPRSITFTSVGPSEGKSSTALALGRHYANMGLQVLLIDADLRKPVKRSKGNRMGLSNYLAGSIAPPDTFQPTGTPNLTLMPSGPLPRNAADLLSGTKFFSLVAAGLDVFDLILIDGPPVLGLADAQLLSSATASTVLVAASGMSRKRALQAAVKRLQLTKATLVGATLTRFDAKATGYGDTSTYTYGYGIQLQSLQRRTASNSIAGQKDDRRRPPIA